MPRRERGGNRDCPILFAANKSPGAKAIFVIVPLANHNRLRQSNRPFPSSCLPPLQSESKCKVFVMLISSTLHMNEN